MGWLQPSLPDSKDQRDSEASDTGKKFSASVRMGWWRDPSGHPFMVRIPTNASEPERGRHRMSPTGQPRIYPLHGQSTADKRTDGSRRSRSKIVDGGKVRKELIV